MHLVFLGTPAAAVPPLDALVEAGHCVDLVVTRPDARRGRGAHLSPSALGEAAARLGIPVAHDLADVTSCGAQLGVVVAYGRIIPARVLDALPMVNVHFSLLPRWRGAAPVERAILAGDTETGVCVMALEATLDTGPVYASETVSIGPDEHVSALRERLVTIGARLLVETLAAPLPEPRAQSGEVTYADKIDPSELELRWAQEAERLERVVRLERAWTTWRGRRLRVLEAEVVSGSAWKEVRDLAPGDLAPGTLVGDVVVAGSGGLRLAKVQPEGRGPMGAATWLRGVRPVEGERLGSAITR